MSTLQRGGMVGIFLALWACGHSRAHAAEAIPAGWFIWPYVEPQAGSALDTRLLNHQPAGIHGRVIVQDGHFATSDDGQRLRFWGCNLSSNEAFVDPATAERLARRLAKSGINIARLHHLDNPWSVDSGGSLWTPGTQDRVHIDSGQLDKLHRVVAALKAEGIYSDVNLKVSRTHTTADGFPASISATPPFQKRVDYFDRRIIDLQKDYARQLLTTKNPYTGLTLAEDPAVAMIEINNENSLLGLRTRDIGAGLEALPEPFRSELARQWNAWLTERYPDDATLAAAWSADATPGREAPFSADSRWRPDAQPGNEVVVDASGWSSLHLLVKPGDGVRWRSAAFVDHLRLVEGATYTLSFAARADVTRPIDIAVSRDDPGWRTDKWRTRGLRASITLQPDWQDYRFSFVVHSVVDVGSRLTILAGHQSGEIWVRNLRLTSGSATAGLRPGESARDGGVPIPTDATPNQWNDWLTFLLNVEQRYVAEMRAFLRDELKVRAPIVCTQANYGGIAGLAREQPSDFIDAHCYWQHPDFAGPTGAWDPAHYTINNTPQVGELGPRWFGELGGIALLRVTNKPFTVTEVDEPAPSDYACEMYPVLATFAGLQDWDAIFPFDAVGIGAESDDGSIRTFFDQAHHPAKWSFSPFATRIFRQGFIEPPTSSRELFVAAPLWREANHVDVLWLRHQPGQDLDFLTRRLSVHGDLLGPGETTRIENRGEERSSALHLARTSGGPVYVADAARALCIVGYVGGEVVQTSHLKVASQPFGLNFAAIGAVSLDDQPIEASHRVLITLAARAENQGAQWNTARTSVGDVWGKGGPPIAERIPAKLALRTDGLRVVAALAPDGSWAGQVSATWDGGWLTFSTTDGPATLHYEVRP